MCLCGKVTNFVEIKTIMRNNTVLCVGSIGLKYIIIIISVIINKSYIANTFINNTFINNTFININVDYANFPLFFRLSVSVL